MVNAQDNLGYYAMVSHLLIEGQAGSGKTHKAIEECLEASSITIIRNVVPVGPDIGFLPGTTEEKLEPYFQMYGEMFKKIFNYSPAYLIKKKRLKFIPTTFLRGCTLDGTVVVDEAQNLSHEELRTVLTRIGRYGRLIVVGDSAQSDLSSHLGYAMFKDTFLKCDNVKHIKLTENYRSPLLNNYMFHENS